MKTLITGASGQLGRELLRIKPDKWRFIAFSHSELDISDSAAVAAVFQKHKPNLVINAAAYTSVDQAESEREKAFAVNAVGAENIARATEYFRARLIHISTDFIFDGTKSQPYLPDDRPNPIGVYGASKLQGEKAVLETTGNQALILRTGWVYSSHGSNFVITMLRLMTERDEIGIVADQVGTPTWARDLARTIYRFADFPSAQGVFHWSDAGVAGWYDFAVAIQEEAREIGFPLKNTTIKPIRTADYPTPAKRPAYSVLDKTATWETLGYTSLHWRDSLRSMLAELKELNHA
jgi:dTDP-4-dehydrorhamnose reductase